MDELTALELIARLKEYGIAYTPREDIDALVEHLEKTFVKPKSGSTASAKKITVDVQLRPMLDDLQVDVDDVKEYISKLKEKACWYCDGIEDHKVVSVKTVVDEFGRELTAYDTPYNYCSNCGRKLN